METDASQEREREKVSDRLTDKTDKKILQTPPTAPFFRPIAGFEVSSPPINSLLFQLLAVRLSNCFHGNGISWQDVQLQSSSKCPLFRESSKTRHFNAVTPFPFSSRFFFLPISLLSSTISSFLTPSHSLLLTHTVNSNCPCRSFPHCAAMPSVTNTPHPKP